MARVDLALSLAVLAAMAAGGCTCGGDQTHAIGGELAVMVPGGAYAHEAAIDLGEAYPDERVGRPLLISNLGRVPVRLVSVELVEGSPVAQGDAPDFERPFTLKLPLDESIEPGGERTATVWFALDPSAEPSAGGNYHAVVRLTASGAEAAEGTVVLRLSARALACPRPSPDLVDFGTQLVGGRRMQSFVIANPGSSPLTVRAPAGFTLEGTPFRFETALPITAPSGTAAEIVVSFRPSATGSFGLEAPLDFGEVCPGTFVRLQGRGEERIVGWSPEVLDCGYVPVGLRASRPVTFVNRGTETARVLSARLTPTGEGTLESDFRLPAEDWTGPLVLAGGESAVRTVQCSPTSLGSKTARLDLEFDVPGQDTGAIPVRTAGGGPKLIADPLSIAFGRTAFVEGARLWRERPLRIGNGGYALPGEELAAALRLGTENAGSYGPPFYRVEVESPGTSAEEIELVLPGSGQSPPIVTGDWLDAGVRVVPTSPGQKRATLVIYSNDRSQPETRIPVSADVVGVASCEFEVLTPSLDFGIVHESSPRTLEFLVKNVGDGECLLSDFELEGATEGFSIEAPNETVGLAPRGTLRLPVRLSPQAPPDYDTIPLTGLLRASISSSTAPRIEAQVRGARGQACLVLLPGVLDFGTLVPGERSAQVSPQLANLCLETATLTSVTLRAPEGGFEFEQKLGEPLPPGGVEIPKDDEWTYIERGSTLNNTRPFGVRFAPTEAGQFQATVALDLVRGGRSLRYVLPLNGKADPSASTEVRFTQGGGDGVDILFYVEPDASAGYRATELDPWEGSYDIEELASQVPTILALLDRSGNDYQIAVIHLPDVVAFRSDPSVTGRFYVDGASPEAVLTSATPDLAAKLAHKIAPPCSPLISCTAEGLRSTKRYADFWDLVLWRALTPPLASGPNAGFRRPGARLALLLNVLWQSWSSDPFDSRYHNHQPVIGDQFPPYEPHPRNAGELAKAFMELGGFPGGLSFGCMRREGSTTCEQQEGPIYQHVLELESLPCQAFAELTQGTLGNSCSPCDPMTHPECVATWQEAWHQRWRDNAELLAEAASGMRLRFTLPTRPDLGRGAIEVSVNGAQVPALDAAGARVWRYDEAANAVRFDIQTTPLPGSEIVIRYFTVPGQ
ncbi:MAG: choice-of-anchor D domain-containing protein [Myxococcales bacterium]